jgi:hypothetical protein
MDYIGCMTAQITDEIIPNDFPELKSLLMDRDPQCAISAKEAFALYERNWRFVDVRKLTEHETQLVRELAAVYGHGVVLV